MNELNRIYQQHKDNPLAWLLAGLAVLIILGSNIWPFFMLVPGGMMIYAASKGDRNMAGLIFPGLIIGGTGAIFLYQSLTGHWESWAYAWTLYPVFVGLGLQFNGQQTGNGQEVKTGKEMVKYGLISFAVLALFFELIIFGGIMMWLLLAAGLGWMWWNGNIKLGDEERDEEYREKVRHFVADKRKHAKNVTVRKAEARKPKTQTEKPKNTDPYSTLGSDVRRQINEALEEADTLDEFDVLDEQSMTNKVNIPVNIEDETSQSYNK